MAFTCDKLPLPDEMILLIKSYAWHDLIVKKNKYNCLQEFKWIAWHFTMNSFICGTYTISKFYVHVRICKYCGNYLPHNGYYQYFFLPRRIVCTCFN